MKYYISKSESIKILKKYFKNFKIKELKYYIDINSDISVPNFLDLNIYDKDIISIELVNFFEEHFELIYDKLKLNVPIKISFVSGSIFWYEIFPIDDTIFLTISYIERIFEKHKKKSYNFVSDVYININKYYDIELLKKISFSICDIIYYNNQIYWINQIENIFNCSLTNITKIKLNSQYKILHEPYTNFISNKIPIYKLNNKLYIVINLICSNYSFSPFWEKKIIQLEYLNGEYIEINKDFDESNINNIYLETNPFILVSNNIINNILGE